MKRHAWLILVLALAPACGGNVQTATKGSGGSSGGQGGTGTGAGGTGAGGTGAGGTGGSGTTTSTTSNGGCATSKQCGKGACIFQQDSCGVDATGTCSDVIQCDGPATGPVCLCDGTVLEGEMAECQVWSMGVPYANGDACAKGTFSCGPMQCKRNVEVCEVVTGGPAGSPPSYSCVPLANIQGSCAHGIADCSCLDATSLGCPPGGGCCTADADHQETVAINAP